MTKRDLPTIEVLHKLLDLDLETGFLTWKARPEEYFGGMSKKQGEAWNRRYAGKRAFTSKLSSGYYQGYILGEHHHAHCVIFAMHNGAWADDQVDHEDQNSLNNRPDNLRSATFAENMQNGSLRKNNKSGHVGVSWYKRTQQWRAYIMANSKQITLGYFNEIDDAIAARKTASIKHGFHPNHGKPKPA